MERFESLPDDLKIALTSEEVDASIQSVAKKHFLHIDQTGELADETGLVMLGLTKTDEYISNLKERLGVPQQKASEIAKDIDEKVLRPIKASLIATSERSTEDLEQPEQEEILDREQIMKEIDEHLQDTNYESDTNIRITNKEGGGNNTNYKSATNIQMEKAGELILPTTPPSVPVGIIEKKLTETVKIPKEETVIDRTSSRYGGQDPYREPIE